LETVKYQLIKKLRKAQKLTQGDVAEKVGIARSYYTRIELGDLEPSLPTLKRMGKVLGIDYKELLK
jgi:transcriptional regulator with XRE-family HTH domain